MREANISFASLAKLFRSHNIPVFLDAAHGVGQIELNVSSLEIDYMVTNCHKWFCANKGCALLWVRGANHHLVRPLVVSHSHHQSLKLKSGQVCCTVRPAGDLSAVDFERGCEGVRTWRREWRN